MIRHVTRVMAFAAGLLLATGAAWAQSSPSHFPAATQPLDGADAVLLDQGSGCASGIQPCVTRQSPSLRMGQPYQNAAAPVTPFLYQQWIDTSVSPPLLKMYIGNSWFEVATLDSVSGYAFNVPASAVTGLGTMATQNANAVVVTGGSITGMPTPSTNSDVATKQYVDGKASGIVFQQGVDYATAAILPNTPGYANGTLGVGRTLTAGSNTTLTVDGTVAVLTKRVLVKNQSDQTQNGCYSVTTGGGGVPWVLTGCTDWDQSAEMQTGSSFIATAGATNAATSWVLNTTGAVTVGATPLAFVQSAASNIYTAGTGLTLGGSVFSITNTGVTAATYGSASQVAQIALNAQGQVATASNVAIALPASSLTNGTTGTGAVVLATSPTFATQISSPNYLIGTGLTTDAGTIGFYNSNGPVLQFYGTASAGTGLVQFINAAGTLMMRVTDAGVMTVPSITTTSTLTAPTLSASTSVSAPLYILSGVTLANTSGVYQVLYDRSGNGALFIGSAGDPQNYYRNTTHTFQNIAGGVTYATINSGGLAVTAALSAGTNLAVGTSIAAGTTISAGGNISTPATVSGGALASTGTIAANGAITGASLSVVGALVGSAITGTSTVNTVTYQLSGTAFATSGGVYQVLYDRVGNQAALFGSAGDPTNYYRNTTHVFGNIGGGTVYATLNSAGLAVTGAISATTSITAASGSLGSLTVSGASNIGSATIGSASITTLGVVTTTTGSLTVSGAANIGSATIGTANITTLGVVTTTTGSLTVSGAANIGSATIGSAGITTLVASTSTIGNAGFGNPITFTGGISYVGPIAGNFVMVNGSGGNSNYGIRDTTGILDAVYAPGGQSCSYSGGASWACTSDARLKTKIKALTAESLASAEPAATVTDAVKQLQPVSYADAKGNRHFGFLAQDLKAVFPDLVHNSGIASPAAPDGALQIDYSGLIAPMVTTMQELEARIRVLEAKIR